MQKKAIASEKLVAAKWPGGQVLPLDRHPLAGRLGRDCFLVLPPSILRWMVCRH